MKPLRGLVKQFLEVAELLEAIDAFQRGEKDQLRRWIDEHYGVNLGPVLGAQLKRNIPKIADNPDADAGAVITLARHWMDGNKKRERQSAEEDRMKRTMFGSWVANGGAPGDFEAAWPELKAERLKQLTLENETEARKLQRASSVSRI